MWSPALPLGGSGYVCVGRICRLRRGRVASSVCARGIGEPFARLGCSGMGFDSLVRCGSYVCCLWCNVYGVTGPALLGFLYHVSGFLSSPHFMFCYMGGLGLTFSVVCGIYSMVWGSVYRLG